MAFDTHSNLGYSTVANNPSSPSGGTSLTVQTGDGVLFGTPPFNCTVWPIGVIPIKANAEIIRCTARSGDVLTIARAQEGTTARAIQVGDQIAASITAKVLTDIESNPGFTGNVSATGDHFEKSRAVAMGHWINVPYSAANFTSDVGTWTVEAADVITNAYSLVGKTLFWIIFINSFSTSGSPTYLRIAIPTGTLSLGCSGLIGNSHDGLVTFGNLSGTILQFARATGGAFTNVTNTGLIAGVFTLSLV